MPELRWILLILGALFIGALAIWEIRRKRHARGQDANAPANRDGERVTPTLDEGEPPPARDLPHRAAAADRSRGDSRPHREPTLTFPDVHLDARGERAAIGKPPVVEIDEASLADLKIEPHTVVDEFSATDRSRASDEALGLVAPTIPMAARGPSAPAPASPLPGTSSTGPRITSPGFAQPPVAAEPADDSSFDRDQRFGDSQPASSSTAFDESLEDSVAEGPGPSDSSPRAPSIAKEDDSLPVARSTDHGSEVLGPATVRQPTSPLPPEAFEIPEPIVEWPDDSVRKIIALRLVSGTGERFQGRAVRQALAAEGFQIGKFEIFHKPGPDARAVLSAASLTKPGTFSLNTMDGQRYGGLSLFAVLPGPLSPVETFDELLLTARSLNDRLRGALQDERGEPLTPTRSASIRDGLASASSPAEH
jgi:FtsZ-interacting cell division protein ZipA